MKISKSFILLGICTTIVAFAYQSYLKRNPIQKDVDYNEDAVDKVESMMVMEPESEYLGNQLPNGNSPFNILYGKGIYANTNHRLNVRNQSESDVIFILEDLANNKIIRNEYIRSYSSFDLTKIPNGTYRTKYYYGKNWNPTRRTKGQITGGFDTNEQFVISDTAKDLMIFEVTNDGRYIYYSEYEIVLKTFETEGNTLQERHINADEFF